RGPLRERARRPSVRPEDGGCALVRIPGRSAAAATTIDDGTIRLAQAAAGALARPSLMKRMRRDWFLLLMIAPGLLYFIVFHYLPLLGNIVAFEDYLPNRGFFNSEWVGFQNFQNLFEFDTIHVAIKNTIVISVVQLFLYFPAPIMLALTLSSVTSTR